MAKLAEVFVQVRLDTSGITAEAERSGSSAGNAAEGGFMRAFKPKANVQVGVDTAKAKAEVDDLKRRIASVGGIDRAIRARVTLDSAEADVKVAKLKGELRELQANKANVKVGANTVEVDAAMAKVKAEIADLSHGKATARAEASVSTAKAKAELADLKAKLDAFGATHTTHTVDVKVNTKNLSAMAQLGEKSFGSLITAGIAVGPALLPVLGATAVGVGALSTSLAAGGAAAGAFGLSVIAQVKGMVAAQAAIKTTTTALGKLVPGSAAYTGKLKELNTQQKDFVKAFGPAAKGLNALKTSFSGFQAATSKVTLSVMGKALSGVAGILPKLVPLSNAAGGAVGKLVDKFVGFTKGKTFDSVIGFFTRVGPKAITAFGTSIGNVAVGFGGILAAFAPMSGGLLSGLTTLTAKFASWGKSLGSSNGFASFMDYVKSTLPGVLHLIGGLATAIGHILTALAPLGHIELGGLNLLVKFFNAIPIGVISIAAAALTAFAVAAKAAALATAFSGAAAKMSTFGKSAAIAGTAAQGSSSMIGGMSKAAGMMRLGVGAAGLGLLMFSSHIKNTHSDLKSLTNVAGAAAMGFAVTGSPWGLAIGGAIALTNQFVHSTDDLNTSLDGMTNTTNTSSNFKDMASSIDTGAAALDKFKTANDNFWTTGASVTDNLGTLKNAWDGFWGKSDEETGAEATRLATAHFETLKEGVSALNYTMHAQPGDPYKDIAGNLGKLQLTAAQATPVLNQMGLTVQDVGKKWGQGGAKWDLFTAHFAHTMTMMDSANGRFKSVGDAISGINDPMQTAAGAAQALGTALQSQVSPNLNLVAANDQLAASFDHWKDSLAKGNRSLKGQTDASRQNRAAVGDRINAILAQNVAEVAAHGHSRQAAFDLENNRNKLLATGRAAGLGGKELQHFVNMAGLTPRLVRTEFRAAGITHAQRAAHDLEGRYKKLPKDVQTYIKTHGLPTTMAGIQKLKGRFKDLDKSDIKILAAILDKASPKIRQIIERALGIKHIKPKITIDADAKGAVTGAATAKGAADGAGKLHPLIHIKADASGAVTGAAKAKGAMGPVDNKTFTSKIKITSNAPQVSGDAKRLMNIPDSAAKINISSNAASVASGAHSSMQISDTYATIHINTVRTSTKKSADGGLITGPGGPRDDLIPVMLSNREFVVNAAATARHLPELEAMNSQRFAAGGLVQRLADGGQPHHHHKQTPAERKAAHKAHHHAEEALHKGVKHFDHVFSVKDTRSETRSDFNALLDLLKKAVGKDSPLVKHLKHLGERLLDVQKAQDKATAAWDRGVAKLDKIKAAAAEYSKTVAAAYTHDAFGGSLEDLNLQEKADTNDAKAARRALAQAKHRGLGGKGGRGLLKELMASGNLALLQQFSHLSHAEIQHEEALYRARQRAAGKLGDASAHDVYGKSIQEQTREVKHLHKVVLHLNEELRHLGREVEEGARKGAHDGMHGRDHKARTHRRGHNH